MVNQFSAMLDSKKCMVLCLAKAEQHKTVNVSKGTLITKHIDTNKETYYFYTLLSGQRGVCVTLSFENGPIFPPTENYFL